jgi:hypothetical protein
MANSDSPQDHQQALRSLIDQAETRSRELRQIVDRIVEILPTDKGIQDLDQFVDVLLVKLSAASIRAARLDSGGPSRRKE